MIPLGYTYIGIPLKIKLDSPIGISYRIIGL